jgi:hypothetical protein
MAKTNGAKPTQHTPQGEEIPIPAREDVFRDLGKVAKPRKRPSDEESDGGGSPEDER